jgi:hypothetical protein
MKKLFTLLAGLALISQVFAQSPASFKYQAIARDGTGKILSNQSVSFRISIQEINLFGAIVYSERHNTTTNEFGLVSLEIGKGVIDTGTLEGIGWGANAHFLKVEMDPLGGTAFQLLGTSQLMSVPYALHAKTVETGDKWGGQTVATDNTLDGNGTLLQPLKLGGQRATTGQVLKFNGTSWAPATDLAGNADPGGLSGQVQFNSGGAFAGDAALVWNNSTKSLGIGTSFPVYDLSINGGLSNPNIQMVNTATGTGAFDGLRMGNSSAGSWLWNCENTELVFATNNLRRMTIIGNGNVGIGVAIPDATLDIQGTIKVGTYGKAINEIREITGTTSATLGYVIFALPAGYTSTNTRVLSVEIFYMNSAWMGLASTSNTADEVALFYQLSGNSIRIYYPNNDYFRDKPFRMILMRVQ